MQNSQFFHVTIVRHGETMENRKKIMQGQMDTQLSDIGIKQAKDTGDHLKNVNIDLIFCSDLLRTTQTANEIIHKNSFKTSSLNSIVLSKLLRERSFGIYSGYSKERWRKIDSKYRGSKTWIPEKGESLIQVHERAVKSFQELCSLMSQRQKITGNFGDSCESCPLRLTCTNSASNCLCNTTKNYLGHALIVSHGGLMNMLLKHLFTLQHCSVQGNDSQFSGNTNSCQTSKMMHCGEMNNKTGNEGLLTLDNCGITQVTVSIGNRNQVTVKQHCVNYTNHLKNSENDNEKD